MKAWRKARRAPPVADAVPETPAAVTATRVVLANIALRTGGALLKRGVERGILGQAPAAVKAAVHVAAGASAKAAKAATAARPRRGITSKLAIAAATRIATRSVPGAIVVGGALLAKSLYDRKQARKPRT